MQKFRIGQCVKWETYTYSYSGPETKTLYGYVVDRTRDKVTLLAFKQGKKVAFTAGFDRSGWWNLDPAMPEDAIVLTAHRGDYKHYAIIVGKRLVIRAGCRLFDTYGKAVRHWRNCQRCPEHYNKTLMRYGGKGGCQLLGRTYDSPEARRERARDKRLNKFSLAFARKAERIRAKKA